MLVESGQAGESSGKLQYAELRAESEQQVNLFRQRGYVTVAPKSL